MNTKTIHCLDDEPELVRLLQILLGRHGFEVSGSTSLSEAKRRLRQSTPDLLLSDVHLADAGTGEVLAWLREDVCGRGIAVILLTGDRKLWRVLDDACASNLRGMIVKPFSNRQLVAAVNMALDAAAAPTPAAMF